VQFTDKMLKAIPAVTDKPVRFLVNAHWHGDHTGGNENIGKGGTIIDMAAKGTKSTKIKFQGM